MRAEVDYTKWEAIWFIIVYSSQYIDEKCI